MKKRNRSGSDPKQRRVKSWKVVGAESRECARSGWERLLEIGWARRVKVKGRKTRIEV